MLPFQRPKPQQEIVEKFSLTLEKNCHRRRSFCHCRGCSEPLRGGGVSPVPSRWRGGFTNPPAFLGLVPPQPFLVTQLMTDWGRAGGGATGCQAGRRL